MAVFDGPTLDEARAIVARYPAGRERSAIMPLLYLAQSVEGHVSREGLRAVAEQLGLTTAEVEAVATFYTLFRFGPTGTHLVNVCTNLACTLRGGRDVLEAARDAAGLRPGQDGSDDGLLTVREEECLGVCEFAPAVQINVANHDRVTPDRVRELIRALRDGEVPAPARGPAVPSFRAASRILAGLEAGGLGAQEASANSASVAPGSGGLGAQEASANSASVGPRERGSGGMIPAFEPRLTRDWDDPSVIGIDGYRAKGGYEALGNAVGMEPAAIIEQVKASGLRGRGGAGFPAGTKWSFVPRATGTPTYVVVNFDESEPGTCNNRELVERDPHRLLEGTAIASLAIGCTTAFIYVRGEYLWQSEILETAIREAYDAGFFGRGIAGSDVDLDVVLHRGAGAYICGEETALLSSLEGFRGQPRLRPPFPAIEGLFASPTVINNVETLMSVPDIVLRGPEWFRELGTEKSPGTKLFTISGKVERPGNYELPLGTPLRVLLEDVAGGMLGGRSLKAWTPGGSSTPLLTAEHIDTPLDYESIQAAGSLLGTGAVMVLDDTDCVVEAAQRMTRFYAHESCGKCTPCREGTWWAERVLDRIERGYGREGDLPVVADMGRNIMFRAFCALADGAAAVLESSLKHFREEFEEHVRLGRCPLKDEPAEAIA